MKQVTFEDLLRRVSPVLQNGGSIEDFATEASGTRVSCSGVVKKFHQHMMGEDNLNSRIVFVPATDWRLTVGDIEYVCPQITVFMEDSFNQGKILEEGEHISLHFVLDSIVPSMCVSIDPVNNWVDLECNEGHLASESQHLVKIVDVAKYQRQPAFASLKRGFPNSPSHNPQNLAWQTRHFPEYTLVRCSVKQVNEQVVSSFWQCVFDSTPAGKPITKATVSFDFDAGGMCCHVEPDGQKPIEVNILSDENIWFYYLAPTASVGTTEFCIQIWRKLLFSLNSSNADAFVSGISTGGGAIECVLERNTDERLDFIVE